MLTSPFCYDPCTRSVTSSSISSWGIKLAQSWLFLNRNHHLKSLGHLTEQVLFKWTNPGLFLLIFILLQKNCRLKQYSNSYHMSRRLARWPFHHHHHAPRQRTLWRKLLRCRQSRNKLFLMEWARKHKGSFKLQHFCCDQQLMHYAVHCNYLGKFIFLLHCSSCWSQQNRCSLNEP